MSRRLQENLVAAFVLFIFIATIVASLNYGPRARLVPIPIAALGALLTIGQIVLQNIRSEKDLRIDLLEFISNKTTEGDGDAAAGAQAAPDPRNGGFAMQAAAFAMVALMLGLFLLIGPLPAMFLFCCGYFVLSRHFSPLRGLGLALLMTGLVYLVFSFGLKVDLSHGLIDLSFGLF